MNIPQFKSLPHTMLTSRYEALRSARSNIEGDNPEGNLLITRGMVAWMKAICDDKKRVHLTPNLPTHCNKSPHSEQIIQDSIYHKVIGVLTTMVIALC